MRIEADTSSWRIARTREFLLTRCQPLPAQHVTLPLQLRYSLAEYARICAGFTPRTMDERWFAQVEENVLRFYRTWSGFCVFEARFARQSDAVDLVEARVNRDPEQYRQRSDAYDAQCLRLLIQHLLLQWPAPAHTRP